MCKCTYKGAELSKCDKTVRLTVDLDAGLHKRFKATAAQHGMNTSDLVREFVEEYITNETYPMTYDMNVRRPLSRKGMVGSVYWHLRQASDTLTHAMKYPDQYDPPAAPGTHEHETFYWLGLELPLAWKLFIRKFEEYAKASASGKIK